MAALPFDHASRDRKAGGQIRVIVQEVSILTQIMRAMLHRGTLRLRQATRRCRTPEVGYDLAAAPAQQLLQPRRYPSLSLQGCCRVEGFGRWPQIPQDMDQVEHHPQ